MERWIKLVNGVEIEMTPEEIVERQAEENTLSAVPVATQLDVIFNTLSPQVQADLAPLKVAVKLELDQGRFEIVFLIIQRAVIPNELESVRQDMLDVVQGAMNPIP